MSKKPKWHYHPSSKKIPRLQENPPSKGFPRREYDPQSTDYERISWHLNTVDRGGEWGWHGMDHGTFWDMILGKIKSYETMTWAQIKQGTGSKSIPIKNLCRNAQRRLNQINQEDIAELFELRLSGRRRVWGIRAESVLKILWWDPEHTVCPSHR